MIDQKNNASISVELRQTGLDKFNYFREKNNLPPVSMEEMQIEIEKVVDRAFAQQTEKTPCGSPRKYLSESGVVASRLVKSLICDSNGKVSVKRLFINLPVSVPFVVMETLFDNDRRAIILKQEQKRKILDAILMHSRENSSR